LIAAGSEAPYLAVLEAATKKEIFRDQQGVPVKSAFSIDGRYLVTSFANSTLAFYELPGGKRLWQLKLPDTATRLNFSHDGSLLAAGGGRPAMFMVIDAR